MYCRNPQGDFQNLCCQLDIPLIYCFFGSRNKKDLTARVDILWENVDLLLVQKQCN